MNKIPKEIIEKIEQRNKLNAEIKAWLDENVDIDGMYLDSANIVTEVCGDEQGDKNCKEWCNQTTIGEDSFYGDYYWETEIDGKYLTMEFSC